MVAREAHNLKAIGSNPIPAKLFIKVLLQGYMEENQTVLLAVFLLSITGYSIYIGFGPPSKKLRDPFEEHEN